MELELKLAFASPTVTVISLNDMMHSVESTLGMSLECSFYKEKINIAPNNYFP